MTVRTSYQFRNYFPIYVQKKVCLKIFTNKRIIHYSILIKPRIQCGGESSSWLGPGSSHGQRMGVSQTFIAVIFNEFYISKQDQPFSGRVKERSIIQNIFQGLL